MPAELPFGPLPQPSSRHQILLGSDTGVDQLNQCAVEWQDAAHAEWKSLIGELRDHKDPYFRWRPAPGPKASDASDDSKGACQWRLLAHRILDANTIATTPRCSLQHATQTVLRNLWKAWQLADSMQKGGLAATQGALVGLDAALHTLCIARDLGVVASLLALARDKAGRLQRAGWKAANLAWESWLHGSKPKGGQPSKRAFLFVKGVTGSARSPLGLESMNDDILDSIDAVDDLGCSGDVNAVWRIW